MSPRLFRSAIRSTIAFALAGAWLLGAIASAQEASSGQGSLAEKLKGVTFEKHADAPGYSEGPTWRDGEVFFCSGGLLRVGRDRRVDVAKTLGPAGTFLTKRGSILICDNKEKALVELTSDGELDVLAERFDGAALNSLNDLTVDARGNVYWTDPAGSSKEKPTGKVFRLTAQGVLSALATNLAFPNGLEVDPASEKLYVIESQTQKILRYDLPRDDQPLGEPSVFHDLGGSGGDGCAFDANGNLWVADFRRPETMRGRIVVLSPAGERLAALDVPAEMVSNVTFGGPNRDEIFCTTGGPPGVFHAKVGVVGFAGHPGAAIPRVRSLGRATFEPLVAEPKPETK